MYTYQSCWGCSSGTALPEVMLAIGHSKKNKPKKKRSLLDIVL